ncbi:MAG TPA: CHAT domain-containing protein [Blastocatellia bacterium]|nr:CHAT domain-containing protein [Blastocatellia bacterium]
MKELIITHIPAADGHPRRVRVAYRPEPGAQLQERETQLDFAVTEDDRRQIQWYLEEFLIYPWGEFRERALEVEELMIRRGEELFRAIFTDPQTAALYAHVADSLPSTRIVIHAPDPEGIALPWELMRDPVRAEFGDLARLAHSFVRSQPNLIFEPPPPRASETFNILIVICRPGGPEGDVPFQSVARPLLELFRPHRDRINLDVLRPPSFEELSRRLSEKPGYYHVLHFDGHGAFPHASDATRFYGGAGRQGLLLFEGEDGNPRAVSGGELGSLLAGKGVPIVLLNACQSGMTHPEALYPSVGNQLLKAGARGVVAMAYSVYVQTAVRFMARLYEGLINGEELSRATALAREDLRAHPQRLSPVGEINLRDWMVPVLFEAAPVTALARGAEVRLDLGLLEDRQAKAGAEFDCPEPPAFGLVGRDGLMLELERGFQPRRAAGGANKTEAETVVLLEGMAGVGKTETAVGFARWWAETGGLEGPIFFFSFGRHTPLAGVCDRVGQVFGPVVKAQLKQEWHLLTAEQRKQVALAILKQVRCLMIWDNFEPVGGFPAGTPSLWTNEEQKELRDFLRGLRGGRTKVLLTSRRDEPWLGKIYGRVEVGGLKLHEAQELAMRVLRRAGLNTAQIEALPAYNELLKYLRGNPLAIQVVLPELKRTTPDALLRALQTGAASLGEDDPRQGRERSLTASLRYRLDALDPALRKRLGVLALFQGFVNAQVLAAMCKADDAPELIRGLDRDEWIKVLNAADEVGLVRKVAESYYTVHPALPWFFHDLLAEAFPDRGDWFERAFSGVYADYGNYLFQLFKTNTATAMSLLRAEEPNLTYAIRLARKHERWDDVEGTLYGMNQLLTTQGRWVEWRRLIGELEGEAADAEGNPLPGREGLWTALLGHRSEIAHYDRDFDLARVIHLRLKEYYEHKGDERNQAVALHQLGRIAEERRQLDEAERWYRQSLAIEERIGNEHGQAQTLHQLGRIAQERRQFDEAERWYRQSLAIKERIGDEHGQASTLHQLGMIAEERGNISEAGEFYKHAESLVERLDDPYHLDMVRESLKRIEGK